MWLKELYLTIFRSTEWIKQWIKKILINERNTLSLFLERLCVFCFLKGDVLGSWVLYSILVGKIDTAQPRWQRKDSSERLKEIYRWVLYISLLQVD